MTCGEGVIYHSCMISATCSTTFAINVSVRHKREWNMELNIQLIHFKTI